MGQGGSLSISESKLCCVAMEAHCFHGYKRLMK